MREKVLLALIVWTVCAVAARAQSGPDNDPDTAPGYVNSIFHIGQVDSINLYNGQLMIPISLGPSYPVGPKLKFQAVLIYNSRQSEYGHPTAQPPDFVYQPFAGNPALGQGWEVTLGAIKLCKQGNTSGFCYFGTDGSQHMFNQGSKTGDGSQLYLSGSGPFDMWAGRGTTPLSPGRSPEWPTREEAPATSTTSGGAATGGNQVWESSVVGPDVFREERT